MLSERDKRRQLPGCQGATGMTGPVRPRGRLRATRTCWVSWCLALLAGCSSLPGGVDPLGYGQERITSSVDDTQTDVAFLDAYKPERAALAGLVPRGPNGTLLALPGLWEGTFWSYCLHAGVHRPSEGDGYAYAPLKGPDAQVIRHILQNQLTHPEIAQPRIQALIWAILARTRLSDSTPEIRATAQALLSPDEIARLNGGALGNLPPELLDRILAMLPPELRQVARVNADLRAMLNSPFDIPYAQLERIAAPLGELPAPPGSREIPVGRWSYDESQRLFVRYFPNGYARTRVQFYAPEILTVDRDPAGRISTIADRSGARVDLTYKPEAGTTTIQNDPGVRIHSFASIKLTAPDRQRPWETSTLSLDDIGWVLIGVPNGNGRASGENAALVQQRYDGSVDLTKQVQRMQVAIRKRVPGDAGFDMGSLTELGAYAAAVRAAYGAKRQDDAWAAQAGNLFYRAWMSRAASSTGSAGTAALAGAASGGLSGYDPSGSATLPGNTGKQRLGQSGNDNECKNGADNIDKAKGAIKVLSGAASMSGITRKWNAEFKIFKKMLDFELDMGRKINDAMTGCTRTNHVQARLALQSRPALAQSGQQPSAQVGQAFDDARQAWSGLNAQLERAVTSQGQYRKALAAGDQAAAGLYAREIATHLHATGKAMLRASSGLSALARRLQAEDLDWPVTRAAIREYQQELKANGFSEEDLAAAKALGMSDAAIAAAYEARLEPVTDWEDTTMLNLYHQAAEALDELGRRYAAVPVSG